MKKIYETPTTETVVLNVHGSIMDNLFGNSNGVTQDANADDPNIQGAKQGGMFGYEENMYNPWED